MEYQDPEAADTASNQEGEGMEADGIGVEAGTAHQSLPQLSSLVSIMTIRDVSDMLCTHNCLTEYSHDHKHCKGVHSLMPDLGCFLIDGGLATASLWIPPEV